MNRFPFFAANRTWLIVWTVLLILLFASVGLKMISTFRANQRAAAARHASRVDPDADEPGVTAADRSLPPGAKPIRVTAGYYVDRIVEMSVKDVFWTVEFYLWFRWQGDTLKTCEGFDVVDGSVERKEKEVDETIGGQRYQRFRVLARITKFFDVTRFPCDDHLLTLAVELPSLPRHELMFVPDQQGSAVSSRVRIPSYTIWQVVVLEKPHSYQTNRGDPRLAPGSRSTYSQLRMGIEIRRSGWGMFVKLFQSLFVAVLLALLALFIRPTEVDPRFGLGAGALFAAVANAYVVSSLVPETGDLALADMINGVGIGVILLTVVQSTISLYLYSQCGEERLSRAFDRTSFFVILPSYTILNVLLLVFAMP